MIYLNLDNNWQLKERGAVGLEEDFGRQEGWIPAQVPGTVHQDLMTAGVISDPFVGLNEHDVQWVGERDWLYLCMFDVPSNLLQSSTVALCMDGLDTFATVWLNGECLFESDNQFVPRRTDVRALLRSEGNEIRILFESALRRGREREAEHCASRVWNGDPSRVYVRKAQFHYGWDWGPCLLSAGPWRAIRFEAYEARLSSLHCPVEVSPDLQRAVLPVSLEIEAGSGIESLDVRLQLLDSADRPVQDAVVKVVDGRAAHVFEVIEPDLWWPRGHGGQPLYRLIAMLLREGQELDRREQRLGLRRSRLVQEPVAGEQGTTFQFEVNNVPLFCGGYNWIPADSFIPRITAERYREWVRLAADGNAQMLRVWGGGIYEQDAFYDACDEHGILVWQDFMFACGMYPALGWFQESVRAEALATLERLRHHPSIVLWCGNNEDYQIARSVGAYNPDLTPQDQAESFPARQIYEELLPEVCNAADFTRPYWPGSPYVGSDGNDPTAGDRHVWDVWHGAMSPYQEYPAYRSRFISEFGMQALPAREAVEGFAPPEERYPQSRTVEHHNKAEGGPRRIAVYLADNVRTPSDLDSYIYSTQLIQAEALAAGVRGWRRRWTGPGAYACSGALIWQLNDCWPVTSWAVVDSALRPKTAYYVVRRELAPLALGLARGARGVDFWAVNATGDRVPTSLELSTWTLEGAQVDQQLLELVLPPYGVSELGSLDLSREGDLVVGGRMLVDGQVRARASLWPEPLKYLHLPDPGIELEPSGDDRIVVRAALPAKGVVLSTEDRVVWSDNALDLLPGDEQHITLGGSPPGEVSVCWLGGSETFKL